MATTNPFATNPFAQPIPAGVPLEGELLPAKPTVSSDNPFAPGYKPRSALGEIGSQLAAGVTAEVPRQAGQALQYVSEPGQPLYEAGKGWAEAAQKRLTLPEYTPHPEAHGAVVNALASGARMLAPSVAAPLAVAAGLTALPEAAIGGTAALGLSALAGSIPAALQQGQQTLEDLRAQGVAEEDARAAARRTAAIEGAGETLGTYAGGKLFGIGARALSKELPAGEAALAGATAPGVIKPFLKQLPETAATEVATEIGQGAGQAAVEQAYGGKGPTPLEAAGQAIGPTLGMTALLAPLGLAGFAHGNRVAQRRAAELASEKTDLATREKAADAIAKEIEPHDKVAAAQFRANVMADIQAGAPIALGPELLGPRPAPVVAPAPPLATPPAAPPSLGPVSRALNTAVAGQPPIQPAADFLTPPPVPLTTQPTEISVIPRGTLQPITGGPDETVQSQAKAQPQPPAERPAPTTTGQRRVPDVAAVGIAEAAPRKEREVSRHAITQPYPETRHGGRGPRSGIREEAGYPTVRGEGVQPGRPEGQREGAPRTGAEEGQAARVPVAGRGKGGGARPAGYGPSMAQAPPKARIEEAAGEPVARGAPDAATAVKPVVVAEPQARGAATTAATPKGQKVSLRYQLVEAADLVASHNLEGKPNPDYPTALQPRDRSRQASTLQIQRIAGNLAPERLGASPTVSEGAPIIGPDKAIESGNGRVLAIRKAYGGEKGKAYREHLQKNAAEFGLDPTVVKAMTAPVLVRTRTTKMSDAERAAFTRDANESTTARMSPAEEARADAARIGTELTDYLPGEDGNVLAMQNRGFVKRFIAGLAPEEAAALTTADGAPTKQLADRIRAAVFYSAYRDERLLGLFAEEADPEIRNVIAALNRAAPEFARARGLSEDLGPYNIIPAIVEAAGIIRQARVANQVVTEAVAQQGLFGVQDPNAQAIALFMDANKRSGKRLGDGLRAMAGFIEGELRKAGNLALFAEQPPTLGDVINRVNQYIGAKYGQENAIEPDLFSQPERGERAAAPRPEGRKREEGEPARAPAATGEEGPVATPKYGAANKVFTAEAAATARERLRGKLGTVRAGLDPKMFQDGLTLAGFHIEAGARKFADFSKAMIKDLGEGIRPYLRQLFNTTLNNQGFDFGTPAEEAQPREPTPVAIQEPQGLSDDEAKSLFDEAQALMRKLPSNIGKAQQEGRLSAAQQSHLARLDEIDKLLPSTSQQWQTLWKEARAEAGVADVANVEAYAQQQLDRLKKETEVALGDEVSMQSAAMLPNVPGQRYQGTVKQGKRGNVYVHTASGNFDVFRNPWRKVEAPLEPKAAAPEPINRYKQLLSAKPEEVKGLIEHLTLDETRTALRRLYAEPGDNQAVRRALDKRIQAAAAKPPAAAPPEAKAGPVPYEIGDEVRPIRSKGLLRAGRIQHIKFDSEGGQRLKVEGQPSGLYFSARDYELVRKEAEAAIPEKAETVKPAEGPQPISPKPAARYEVGEKGTKPATAPAIDLAHQLRDHILNYADPITPPMLFRMTGQAYAGTAATGAYTTKDAYDSLELGLNLAIGRTLSGAVKQETVERAQNIVNRLEETQNRLPTPSKRSDEQVELQQFSTPQTHAHVMAWVANLRPEDVVLEPSAGTGNIVTHALLYKPKAVHANEISERRAALVAELGVPVSRENAVHINALLPDVTPTVVLMNPPFSANVVMKGKKAIETGAEHVEAALKKLAPNGRLVALLGRGMGFTETGQPMPRFREWWGNVQKEYTVRAVYGIDGREYRKFGTEFDTALIVIDKTGPTTQPIAHGNVEKVRDLPALLEGVRNERTEGIRPGAAAEQAAAREPREEGAPGARPAAGTRGVVRPATGGVVPAGAETARPERPGGHVEPGRAPEPGRPGAGAALPVGERPGAEREAPAERGGAVGGGAVRAGGAINLRAQGQDDGDRAGVSHQALVRDTLSVENTRRPAHVLEVDAVFENYRPQIKIKGAKGHPAILAESAAMGSVNAPESTYSPSLPQRLIDEGRLSDAQLVNVVQAGESHGQLLPGGERRGYFIGDGTGVGKGAQIAGIILDNWNQGRKRALWVSENGKLFNDATRDIEWVGMSKDDLHLHNKFKADITMKEGVMFTTYDTLKGEIGGDKAPTGEVITEPLRRLDQLIKWLGEDFDGVIAFDEAHNLGNSLDQKGDRGVKRASIKALAGITLQQRLPKARVLYVSATGATNVENLAYTERLGLWGEGTAFPNKQEFIDKIRAGGVATMEVVAKDMKAMGLYEARNLAFTGVEQRELLHPLTPEQTGTYNEIARAWQMVLANVGQALKITGADKNSRAKSNAMAQFWGSQQRFFNQVMTSLSVPSLIRDAETQLKARRSVVMQLVNTNEATQERRLAQAAEQDIDIGDIDINPRDILMQYVQNAFPTQLYEKQLDEQGNEISVAVQDSLGAPVEDPEALAKKDALLERLASLSVPEGVLEQIINHFGTREVAEITGRSRRVVRHPDGTTELESLSPSKSNKDADAFMAGTKRILVFSDAGGTGRSYHADLRVKNQDKRVHYLVQPGWRADKAVQGLGRTHRTNQAHPPEYALVTTNLKAQRRFMSSIARRLDQLGALTKGQRDTASQGLFSAEMNLENQYAAWALRSFAVDALSGRIEGITRAMLEEQMGLHMTDPQTGQIVPTRLPTVPRFLNRLLALETDVMDRVFDAFYERLEAGLDYARQQGTLDVGMETIRAQSVKKLTDKVVAGGEGKGETRYVKLALTDPVRFVQFDQLPWVAKPDIARNRKSGKLYAFVEAPTMTDPRSGELVSRLRRLGVRDQKYVPKSEFDRQTYETLDLAREKLRAEWDAEIAASPQTRTKEMHLITGALLPVWDRLPTTTPKVLRTQTDEGERLLGREIPQADLSATLTALGAEGERPDLTPAEMQKAIMDDAATLVLANGWRIGKRTVSGEERIEVMGPTGADFDILKRQGAFTEIIAYRNRVFLPTGNAAEIIERITKSKPVIEVAYARGAPRYSRGTARYSYLGKMAALADHSALGEAIALSWAGTGMEDIREKTGWFKGKDEKWRFEISDKEGTLRPDWRDAQTVGAAIRHDKLFNNYLAIGSIGFSLEEMPADFNGYFDPKNKRIVLNRSLDPKTARSVLLHEIQHVVQNIERFSGGGSPDSKAVQALALKRWEAERAPLIKRLAGYQGLQTAWVDARREQGVNYRSQRAADEEYRHLFPGYAEEAEKLVKELDALDLNRIAHRTYRRLLGEVEARDVQARADMRDEERRLIEPYISQGIDEKDFISNLQGERVSESRGKEPASHTPDTLRTALSDRLGKRAFAKFLGSREFRIVARDEDLPAHLQHPEGGVRGVFDKGVSYLVAANIRPGEELGVALHEIGVHHGLEGLLGKDLHTKVLGEIERLAKVGKVNPNASPLVAAVMAARARVPNDTAARYVTEETLAYLVENRANHELPLVKRILAAVRAFLLRMGVPLRQISPDDLVALATASVRKVARAKTPTGLSAGITPSAREMGVNGALASTKQFADRGTGETIRVKGFKSLDRERQQRVLAGMLAQTHDPEILRAVIQAVPVNVMHDFTRAKLSPEDLLHDPSVFWNAFPVTPNAPVRESTIRFVESVAALEKTDAGLAAKQILAGGFAGAPLEGGIAERTLEGRHGVPPEQGAVSGAPGREPGAPILPRRVSRGETTQFSDIGKKVAPAYAAEAPGLPLFSRGRRPPPGPTLGAALQSRQPARVKAWFQPKLDAARVKLQDRFLMLKRHQEAVEARRGPLTEETDAYLAQTLYHGRAEERMTDLKDKHIDPLIEAIHASGASIAQVDDFLYALHAEERNLLMAGRNPKFDPESEKYGGNPGSGMSSPSFLRTLGLDRLAGEVEEVSEAEQIMQAARDAGLYDGLMAISKRVQALNEATLDGRLRDGLMSQEQVDAWRDMWKHYVPLRGVEGQDELPRIGHGFNIQGAESKHAFGRASKAGDLLAHVVSQAEEAVIRGEKNRVGQTFLRFVQENEGPWQVKQVQFKPTLDPETGEMRFERDPFYTLAPNVLTVKRDGKQIHIQLEDEALARSLKNLGAEDSGAIVRTMGKLTRALSFLSTSANPEFLISNFLRDLQEAGINIAGEQGAAMAKEVMKNVPKALRGAYRAIRKGDTTDSWAKHFREMRAAGGLVGHLDTLSIEKQAGRLQGMLKDLDPSKPRKVLIALRGVGRLIQDSNTVVESGVRLSAYVAARDAGMSVARAAELAKNLTVNFNRRGELGPVMNSLYMFFNAGIQGTTRMIQALGHPRTQKIVGGIVGLGVLLEILNQAMSGSGDDDKKYYDQIPTWVKDHNLIVMMPDGKHYAMLPLPYGYNTFHALGRNVGSLFFGASPIDAAGAILHAGLDAFNPLGGAGSVLQAISPTLLDPLVQQAENLTHFGTPIKPGQSPFGPPKPESTLYWNSVNPLAKEVATWLNDATGGSPVRPGGIDVSPEILQHWTEFMAGGVGKTFMKAVNTGTRLATGEDLPVKEIPFLRRVFGEPDERARAGVYREHLNEVVRARDEIRYFRKAGDPARAAEVAREHGAEMRLYPMAHAIDQQVSALNGRLKLLESRGAPREVRDLLAKRIEALKARFIKRYEAVTVAP